MEYTLIRSSRRTLAVEIDREGRVLVRAPQRCAQKDIDRFIERNAGWISTHVQRQLQRRADRPEPDEAQQAALIARAKAVLPEKVAHYARIMGLSPAGVTITGAKKRFGSCSPKNRICFSWRLMQYPEAAVDYVVVHELAHLVHRNHGPQFYALVASVLPDYKARWQLLKT